MHPKRKAKQCNDIGGHQSYFKIKLSLGEDLDCLT